MAQISFYLEEFIAKMNRLEIQNTLVGDLIFGNTNKVVSRQPADGGAVGRFTTASRRSALLLA